MLSILREMQNKEHNANKESSYIFFIIIKDNYDYDHYYSYQVFQMYI